MSMLSTPRYEVLPAPGRLFLAQELLNTIPAGRPRMQDLLASVEHAQRWVDAAFNEWAAENSQVKPDLVLTEDDLPLLRELRTALHDLRSFRPETVPAPTGVELRGTVDLVLTADGVTAAPSGKGKSAASKVQATILAECFQAQLSGTWTRLKVCKSPKCDVAFYDRSKNASGVWHDVHICGNAINLRASRARQKKA